MTSEHDQIRDLLASYCQMCDDGDFEAFARLFTADARFTVMGTTHTGRDAVVAFMEQAQPPERRGKHIISEPAIELDAPRTGGQCRTDYVFIGRGGDGRTLEVISTGRYVDRVVCEADGRWRLAERRIVFLGD